MVVFLFVQRFRQTGRPADRQTGRPADRQTGRPAQGYRYKQTLLFAFLMIFSSFITIQKSYGQTWQDAVIDSVTKTFSPDSLYSKNEVIIKFKPHALDLSKLCYTYSNDNLVNLGKKSESRLGLGSDLENYLESQRFSVEELILDQALVNRLKMYGGDSLRRMTNANPCVDTISISRNGDTVEMAHYLYMVLKISNDTSMIPIVVWGSFFHQSEVDYICPNGYIDVARNPRDQFYGEQTFLKQAYIGADVAWDSEVGSPDTKVGIFEGDVVDYKHCDLGNGFRGPGKKIIYTKSWTTPEVISPHATHVAGIIGAYTNNKECYNVADTARGGVAGIAGGWGDLGDDTPLSTGASLLSYGFGIETSEFAKLLCEATANCPNSPYGQSIDIANMSIFFLGARASHMPGEEALNFAWENDVALVASRGNWNNPNYLGPACFAPYKITNVGSSEIEGNTLQKADYSMYGRNMDLVAPAPSCSKLPPIIKTVWKTMPNTTPPQNLWGCFSGTSAAAPQVSGAYALIHSYAKKKEWTLYPEDYEGMVKASALDINAGDDYDTNYDNYSGWGQLDLKKLFMMLEDGYKLYHFETRDENVDTTEFSNESYTISISNPTNNSFFIPAGVWSVRQRPITKTVTHNPRWLDDNGYKIFVWGRGSYTFRGVYTGWPPAVNPEPFTDNKAGMSVYFQNGYTGILSGRGGNTSLESEMIHDNTTATGSHTFKLVTYQYKFNENGDIFDWPPLYKLGYQYTVFAKPDTTITSIQPLQDDFELEIHPSPSSTFINVHTENLLAGSVRIIIYNMQGVMLKEFSNFISNRSQIDVSDLPNGMYILSTVNNVSRINKSFIINK